MNSQFLEQQRKNFNNLISQLKTADIEEVREVLSQREIVSPETELTPDIIHRLKVKIKNSNN